MRDDVEGVTLVGSVTTWCRWKADGDTRVSRERVLWGDIVIMPCIYYLYRLLNAL